MGLLLRGGSWRLRLEKKVWRRGVGYTDRLVVMMEGLTV